MPVPGETNRFVLGAAAGRTAGCTSGLTDEPLDAPVPDVPEAPEHEIDFLLGVLSEVLAAPLTRERRHRHVRGAAAAAGRRRRGAVPTSPGGTRC